MNEKEERERKKGNENSQKAVEFLFPSEIYTQTDDRVDTLTLSMNLDDV